MCNPIFYAWRLTMPPPATCLTLFFYTCRLTMPLPATCLTLFSLPVGWQCHYVPRGWLCPLHLSPDVPGSPAISLLPAHTGKFPPAGSRFLCTNSSDNETGLHIFVRALLKDCQLTFESCFSALLSAELLALYVQIMLDRRSSSIFVIAILECFICWRM